MGDWEPMKGFLSFLVAVGAPIGIFFLAGWVGRAMVAAR
jgi:hypothetical protein